MDEAESLPPATKKKKLTLWPSIVVLALLCAWWVFFYWDIFSLLLLIVMWFFSAGWLIYFLVLMLLRRPRKALSFLIPALAVALTTLPVGPMEPAALPIARSLVQSRQYVEFLIYDARHHVKAEVRKNGYAYRKWALLKGSIVAYEIVYDATDGILKKDMTGNDGCFTTVYRVGGHFYMVAEICC